MKPKTLHYQCDGGQSSGSSSPSPPHSPPRYASKGRRKLRSKPHYYLPLRELFVGGFNFRFSFRHMVLLPLLYISGLIMCVGPFSSFGGQPSPPGSLYRSHRMYHLLRRHIQSDNSSAIQMASVWKYKRLKERKPCSNSTASQLHVGMQAAELINKDATTYLIVDANGGLNQQRSAICNAVAVAGLLNAILVIPRFEFHNVWKDSSKFGDIYDEDHFIAALDGHVKVVKELPEALMQRYDYNISNIPNFHVQALSTANYYLGEVLPVLQRERVLRLSPFANRLAMNVPPEIQFLRCLANYEALRFSSPILTFARSLVSQMIEKSSRDNGKYVSVHLRFEEDMVAFSCCVYDGGEAEKVDMDSIRERGWRKKFKLKEHLISPSLNRVNGKCPLTPLEVGMMLRGMGFDNNTSIYLASGKLYKPERYLAPLQEMFPLLHTKESLATPDELAPFMEYSSRMAALDYMVCLLSEVFVTTQGGNFPHFLMGHRRFLYNGHAKTIKPDKRKLAILMDDRIKLSWREFKEHMGVMLAESDRKGLMVPRIRRFNRKTSVYTYPLPECRCLQKPHNTNTTDNKYMLDQLFESVR
ncbi:O-fucosyltransferase 10-like [Cucurbita pepo subsp. pepo]|uniref:O-fucosyltransferase 10-like n=1 Tax=Cucurbita pepo subsp. pepo TaxID=3664 RepID=UPI000C9D2E64|nr:O-fucosyltransferase 10-like [Cucurbita pepo subsp. pepo]